MTRIHPTAVVAPRAELASDVEVGPWCAVDGPVVIGSGCVLMAHATVMGHTTLGTGNRIYPGAVLGAPPQDLKYAGEATRVVEGHRNHFREHVTVHAGTAQGGAVTGADALGQVGPLSKRENTGRRHHPIVLDDHPAVVQW